MKAIKTNSELWQSRWLSPFAFKRNHSSPTDWWHIIRSTETPTMPAGTEIMAQSLALSPQPTVLETPMVAIALMELRNIFMRQRAACLRGSELFLCGRSEEH